MMMSYYDETMDSPLVDIKQLRKDYREGYSAMGHPDRGYYVTNWRGMQSLQAFCSSESVLLWAGDRKDRNVREVQIQNGGNEYEMKAWTDRRYIDMLNRALYDTKEGIHVDRTYWDSLDTQVYEAILENVYVGELDREAFLETATTTHPNVDHMREHISVAFKHDVLRAKDGDTDLYARAAAHAYQNDLAAKVRTVTFDRGPDAPDRDESLGYRFEYMSEEDWMVSAERAYLEYIIDDHDSTTSTTVNLDVAREVMTDFSQNSRIIDYGNRAQEWYDMIDIMVDKDVVFMLNAEPEREIGLGMNYQEDIYKALDLDVLDDLELSFNQSITLNVETGEYDNDLDELEPG